MKLLMMINIKLMMAMNKNYNTVGWWTMFYFLALNLRSVLSGNAFWYIRLPV